MLRELFEPRLEPPGKGLFQSSGAAAPYHHFGAVGGTLCNPELLASTAFGKGTSARGVEDNMGFDMGLVYILREKTSKSPVVMRLLRRLFLMLDLNNIQLHVVTHVRSADNPTDAPSREWDFEDWQLHPAVFKELNRRYGPYSLDAFASDSTALLPRFYSKALCPGSLGMDAFSHSWAGERLWINPPWSDLH
jgi:hypothetical protein